MFRHSTILLLASASATCVFAGKPVASVKGSGPLQVSGAHIPATAASSYIPLVAGDQVHTSSAPATIVFSDKSRVTLGTNSAVKLQPTGTGTGVQVLKGNVSYSVQPTSPVVLVIGQQAINIAGKTGAASAGQGVINNLAGTAGTQAVNCLCFCNNKPPKRSSHCPEDHGNELGDTGGGNTDAPHDCRIDKDDRDHNPTPP